MPLPRRAHALATLGLVLIAPSMGSSSEGTHAARATYHHRKHALEQQRLALAAQHASALTLHERRRVYEEASQLLLRAFREDLFPAWQGTPWDFNGTSTTPGEGAIACGYFVTTLLQHAGFNLERRRLAQQASEWIVGSLSPAQSIRRFRKGDPGLVIDHVRAAGEGLYVVGLDYHVGFILHTGDAVRYCHASYLGPAAAVCEAPLGSAAFVSRYHVVGKLFTEPMLEAWLTARAIPTITR